MTNRETNEQCLLVHMKAEAEHDMAAVLATIHPDALFEDQPLGLVLNGRDATARHYRTWWDAFGIQTDGGVLHWVSDDLAIGEADFVGTHVGRFLGVEPTGLSIRFPFTVYVRFKDGLLWGERFFYDLNMIMAQLGQPSVALAA